MRPSIIAFGEVLWDLFPKGPRFGGAPANFACHAALLGADVAMLSAVGCDDRGDEAFKILNEFGVDTSLVQRAEASTGTVGVSLDGQGKPSFTIHAPSAWDAIKWNDDIASRIISTDTVYFGTLGQREPSSRDTLKRMLSTAKQLSLMRVVDVNLRKPYYDDALIRDSVAMASVVKLSDEELHRVLESLGINLLGSVEATLREMLRRYSLDLIAMTRGADGALIMTDEQTIDQPGVPTEVCDSVGAGDAFTAALIVGLLKRESLADTARKACEYAARVCEYPGAVPHALLPRKPVENQ